MKLVDYDKAVEMINEYINDYKKLIKEYPNDLNREKLEGEIISYKSSIRILDDCLIDEVDNA